jgi:polyisoprenoid-binding protein YceI
VSTVCPASRWRRFAGFPPLRASRPASRRWRFSGFLPLRSSRKLPFLAAAVVLVAAGLVGCPSPPRAPAPPAERRIPSAPPALQQGRQGRPYDIASSDSLLTLRVFRGGALAKAGHNHVIASHTLRGTFYVPADPARTSFEVHLPVTDLTIDEAALREQEHSEDFPPDIPDSAKEGTRKNMLSPALLDGEHYPEILLQSGSLDPDPAGTGWLAHIQVTVRDRTNTVVVPVRYEQQGDAIILTGEFPLKQTDLGLTPFTALLGALQVVDEMKVRFHIVARAGPSLQP